MAVGGVQVFHIPAIGRDRDQAVTSDHLPKHALLDGESIFFSRQSPAGVGKYHYLILGGRHIKIICSLEDADYGYETVIQLPLEASAWIVDAITSLLLPLSEGGTSSSTFSLEYNDGSVKFTLRRTASVEGEHDPGFTIYARGGHKSDARPDSVAWSDRILFDGGLFAALHRVATQAAATLGMKATRNEALTIRPNWMGASPLETPPLDLSE